MSDDPTLAPEGEPAPPAKLTQHTMQRLNGEWVVGYLASEVQPLLDQVATLRKGLDMATTELTQMRWENAELAAAVRAGGVSPDQKSEK